MEAAKKLFFGAEPLFSPLELSSPLFFGGLKWPKKSLDKYFFLKLFFILLQPSFFLSIISIFPTVLNDLEVLYFIVDGSLLR